MDGAPHANGPQIDAATNASVHPTRINASALPTPVAMESTEVGGPWPTPLTPDALHAWLIEHVGVRVPRRGLIAGHAGQFEYLCFSFFGAAAHLVAADVASSASPPEAARPLRGPHESPRDCVVWANRGGGKTFLGAIATMLDLVFRPGIEIRILGGSLEQSRRMYVHLRRFFDARTSPLLADMIEGRISEHRLTLCNGSMVELLAQSQTSVRGTRVQKLRCDEVDLFKPDVWEAAQLTTRSKRCGGTLVEGSVECLSTMHVPHGVMHHLVQEARSGSRYLFRWGVVDSLEHCPDSRACDACALQPECGGRAKERGPDEAGHMSIADAVAMKRRVSLRTWNAEMLCLRPSRSSAVLPEFDPLVHVVDALPAHVAARALVSHATRADAAGLCIDPDGTVIGRTDPNAAGAWLAGMDFGWRAPTVVLWAYLDERDVLWVVDEYLARGVVLEDHIRVIVHGLAQEHVAATRESQQDAAVRDPRAAPRAPHPEARPQRWPACAWIGVDPAGNNTNEHTGVSSVAKMRAARLDVRTRRMTVSEGLNLVRARLAPADASSPRLMVHARCVQLIESLERYHFPDDDPDSDKPVKRDGFDHAVDALRYLIQNLDKPHRTGLRGY